MSDTIMTTAQALAFGRAVDAARIASALDAIRVAREGLARSIEERVDARLVLEQAQADYDAIAALVRGIGLTDAFRARGLDVRETYRAICSAGVGPAGDR